MKKAMHFQHHGLVHQVLAADKAKDEDLLLTDTCIAKSSSTALVYISGYTHLRTQYTCINLGTYFITGT